MTAKPDPTIARLRQEVAALVQQLRSVMAGGGGGTSSRTILNGNGAPGAGLGSDGDFYIDTVADAIYGPKTAGAWGSATSLVGPPGNNGTNGTNGTPGTNGINGTNGADGKTVLNGSGAPGAGLGANGDFYIDTVADAIYGPKTAGVWGSATSLIGPSLATVDNLVKLPAGLFTCAMTSGAALGTVAQAANRNTIAPFRPQFDMTIDQVGISISTAVAASTAKVVIYASNPATGLPSTLIAESADISCAAVATVMTALSVTFEAGKTYWVGVRASATQTLRSITSGGLPMLAITNATTPIMQGALAKAEPYATPAAAWGFLTTHLTNLTVPLVLMRTA